MPSRFHRPSTLVRAPARLAGAVRALLFIVAPLAAFGAVGCAKTTGPPGGGAPQGPPPVPVQLASLRQADIEDRTEYVASLSSLRSTLVQPQVDGQITLVAVKSGDRVKTGDPLFQIDARRQQAAVSSQEATQAALEANVSQATSELERAKTLLAAGAISRQAFDQAGTAVKTAEAALRAQQAQIQQGQVQLRYYTVTAPTAGVVGDVPARVGNQVTTSTMLTSIDQIDSLEVHVQVPIERAAELRTGLPLRVLASDGLPAASTTVSFVSSRVDDATQTVLAKGILNNPGSLRAQQFVQAQIVWKTTPGLLIPVLAVMRVSDQFFAFVASGKDGALVASQRPIRLGAIVGNDYVLLDGVKPDERMVVSGVQRLADGAPLMPIDRAPAGSQR